VLNRENQDVLAQGRDGLSLISSDGSYINKSYHFGLLNGFKYWCRRTKRRHTDDASGGTYVGTQFQTERKDN
jgi:hypothetical protein